MPTFRDVTVSLQSQYDAQTIPERLQVSNALTSLPRNESISSLDLSNDQDYVTSTAKTSRSPTINISIPSFPCSQFWINYSCEPPYDAEVQYYYFKLFVGSKCILSWGIGEKEGWSGKTMYGLYSAGTDFDGRKIVEKKGMFFPKKSKQGDAAGFEIRVFRAKARKREGVKYETFMSMGIQGSAAFDFGNLGRVRRGERQRAYTYALLDPKDEPYVTFRYTIRSDHDDAETGTKLYDALADSQQIESYTLPPCSVLSNKGPGRKLSVPPRKKLMPTGSRTRAENASPTKKQLSTFLDDGRDEVESSAPAPPLERERKTRDWLTRTPSPMVSRLFELPATPPNATKAKKEKEKPSSKAMLKEAMTNKFKKRDPKPWELGKGTFI